MSVIILPDRWRRQPQGTVEVDWNTGLFNWTKTGEILIPGANGARGYVSRAAYALNNGLVITSGPGGLGYRGAAGSTSFIELAADADSILDATYCTMLVVRSLTSTSFSGDPHYGYNAGPSERVMVHNPYSDGTIYWDYGNATSGSGRVSYSGSGTWAAGAVECFVFVAGARGREIWRNGILVANNTGATATRSATGAPFRFPLAYGASVSNPEIVYFFAFTRDEWTPAQIVEWSRAPYGVLKAAPRKMYFLAPSASVVTANGTITLGAITSSASAAVAIAATSAQTLAGITASGTASVSLKAGGSITIGSITLSPASAAVAVKADSSQTVGAITVSPGAAAVGVAATSSQTVGSVTVTGLAGVALQATCSATVGAITTTSGAAVSVKADGTITLGSVTVTGSAAVISGVSANATITVGAITSSAAATVAVAVSGTPTLGAITASGASFVSVKAAGTIALGAVTSSATAAVTSGPVAVGTITLGALTVTGAGLVAINAVGTVSLAAISADASAAVAVKSSGATSLGAVTATASAIVTWGAPPIYGDPQFIQHAAAQKERLGGGLPADPGRLGHFGASSKSTGRLG